MLEFQNGAWKPKPRIVPFKKMYSLLSTVSWTGIIVAQLEERGAGYAKVLGQASAKWVNVKQNRHSFSWCNLRCLALLAHGSFFSVNEPATIWLPALSLNY